MTSSKYIWFDSVGEGRNEHGMFRRSFDVKGPVKKAELHLFADSVYELYVNGRYVEFGPARFDPQAPEYDTHDLAPHLIEGSNVVAVLVKHFGCLSYRAMPSRAGLIAWGEVHTDQEHVELCSGLEWKACRSTAYQPDAPKMSFALEAMEVFRQANEPEGWRSIEFDDSGWKPAVEIDKQDSWGALSPRSIPFMSGKEVHPGRVMHLGSLLADETVYSFRVPSHYWYETHFDRTARKNYASVLFFTWIYSPQDQAVDAGLFWGEHWLNGHLLVDGKTSTESSLRIDHKLKLSSGWNSFFGKIDPYFDVTDFYLGLPANMGLVVSADCNLSGEGPVFKRTGILRTDELKQLGGMAALSFNIASPPDVPGGWVDVAADQSADNPARDRDWDRFGPDVPGVTPADLTGRVFRKKQFPDGFAIELDLGSTRLIKTELELEGVAGATVDLAYSEYLHDGERVRVFPDHQYHSAARAKCSRNKLVWNPVQPHGFRYLVLTVRHPAGDVRLNRLTLRSAEYPVEPIGSFQCSDPLLNKVWDMCHRTEMTDMEDAYIDCPGRERGMYIRDTIIQYHNNLAMFGDHKLMRRCLALYGRSAAPDGKFRATYPLEQDYTIADFCLNAIEGFRAYVEQTGDLSVVEECWDAIKRNLQWFHDLSDERKDGLLDADWYIRRKMDSRYMGFHGDNQSASRRDGVNTAFSAFYLCALHAAAQLADRLDDAEYAADCRRRHQTVTSSLNRLCWDEEAGTYADTIEKKNFSPQAAMLAVRAGVPDEHQRRKIRMYFEENMKHLFVNKYDPSEGVWVSPHFCFYLFDALYEFNLPGLAEKFMREGWSWMRSLGTATCTEFFSEKGSWCHAWSASPAYYLSKHALGVHVPDPARPDEIEIRIQTGSLLWAEGVWPHARGPIRIKWHSEDGKLQVDHLDLPSGVILLET